MTRLRADLLLLITAIVWGLAFVAQKSGMEGIGPFGFVGLRFLLTLMVILPFVFRERKRAERLVLTRGDWGLVGLLCVIFTVGGILQQAGILYTSVTNAGFLTGLYVVFVPFIGWRLFRMRPPLIVWLASGLALAGVWLLNGAHLQAFGSGDFLVMACAVCFAAQVVLLGVLLTKMGRPILLTALQCAACMVAGLVVGIGYEGLSFEAVQFNWVELGYAGIISGGIGFTLQSVAQQHTPPSDTAIILSSEALVAAVAGAVMMNERLDMMGWGGCALILVAILMIEVGPALKNSLLSRVFTLKNTP